MKEKAIEISEIIKDYQGNGNVVIDEEHVLKWVNQFDEEDREFLLTELSHILSQTYFSKVKIVQTLLDSISFFSKQLAYKDDISFLANSVYISTQGEEKSQTELLKLFYEEVEKKYKLKKQNIGSKSKRNVIYFDDVLATGKTLFREVKDWLNKDSVSQEGKKYYHLLDENKFKFTIFTICCHEWGQHNFNYRIKAEFSESVRKKISHCCAYTIENNPKSFKPKLNLVYPTDEKSETVQEYFDTIDTGDYETNANFAYRKVNTPTEETFFTSAENRIRYESIILAKGIELLNQVTNLKNKSLRPLGYTVRSHKTFGIGTQFFTYRNISNTNPLVFWWETNDWYPLFPVKNRG